MSGNVWEWCLTDYESADDSNIDGNTRRVVRGGAWSFSQHYTRAAYRHHGGPVYWYYDRGFRVCAVPINDL